jgi:hypothetical protein
MPFRRARAGLYPPGANTAGTAAAIPGATLAVAGASKGAFAMLTGLTFLLAATSFPGEPVALAQPHVELAVGYRIVGRQLEAVDADNEFLEGESLVLWSAIAGVPAGFVEHVWLRDGVEVDRQYLPVGSGRRWRTWSRHRAQAGAYQVLLIGPDGSVLARSSFTVIGFDEDPGC